MRRELPLGADLELLLGKMALEVRDASERIAANFGALRDPAHVERASACPPRPRDQIPEKSVVRGDFEIVSSRGTGF